MTTGAGGEKNVVLNNNMSRFWIEYCLISKKILEARNDHYNIYTAAIGPGTLLGDFIFIFDGKYMLQSIVNSQACINCTIGCILPLPHLYNC